MKIFVSCKIVGIILQLFRDKFCNAVREIACLHRLLTKGSFVSVIIFVITRQIVKYPSNISRKKDQGWDNNTCKHKGAEVFVGFYRKKALYEIFSHLREWLR